MLLNLRVNVNSEVKLVKRFCFCQVQPEMRGCALPCVGMAQARAGSDDRGMKMRAELVVSAPAEDTWMVVGERFGEIGEWASPITRSAMDGPPGAGRVRTCHVAGFGPVPPGVIRERLLHFDPHARSLSYEAAGGMPGFIRRAVSNWSGSYRVPYRRVGAR